jgi:RHS repeat-associated protein
MNGAPSTTYRFSTKEWDDDSGLYYFGARYYSPEIGRWTQRDPAGKVDGLNLYLYLDNRPVSW